MQVLAPDVLLDARTLAEVKERLQRISPAMVELIPVPGFPPLTKALRDAQRRLDALTSLVGMDVVPVQAGRLEDARDGLRQLLALTLLASTASRFQLRKHLVCRSVEREVLAAYLAIDSAADAALQAADAIPAKSEAG